MPDPAGVESASSANPAGAIHDFSVDSNSGVGTALAGPSPGAMGCQQHIMEQLMEKLEASSIDAGAGSPLHLREFGLDSRMAELTPDPAEGHEGMLRALDEQQGLVKTVQNDGWVDLIRKLQGPRYRTSFSLPPPRGKGMRFFGTLPTACAGVMLDRRKLDLSDAYMWPSGYYAKTDFNVKADGTLLNGRKEALVTLEDLMHANATLTYKEAKSRSTVTGEVLPYNEVLAFLEGVGAFAGIFARSTRVVHLLWAMGLQAMFQQALPAAGELPLFVHDPERGFRPFGRQAQRAVLVEFLAVRQRPSGSVALPCLPIDTRSLELSPCEQLETHGVYGLTDGALAELVDSLLVEDGDAEGNDTFACQAACMNKSMMQIVLAYGLRTAAKAHNSGSALTLVRRVAPLLFNMATEEQEQELVSLTTPSCRLPVASSMKDESDFVGYLHRLSATIDSSSLRVTIGAVIALEDFASGAMLRRIDEVSRQLQDWLSHSNSLAFRLKSWHELHAHHTPSSSPEISSFVTHRAIENRKQFYNALQELEGFEKSHDVLHGMSKLHALVKELHHPCLRLEMLQYILGLDSRFDLEAMLGVAALAFRIVSDAKSFQGVAPAVGDPVSPRSTAFAPTFQLELVARRMQGLDRVGDSGDHWGTTVPFL